MAVPGFAFRPDHCLQSRFLCGGTVRDLTLFTVSVSALFLLLRPLTQFMLPCPTSDWPPVTTAIRHVLPVSQAAPQRSRPDATSDARNASFTSMTLIWAISFVNCRLAHVMNVWAADKRVNVCSVVSVVRPVVPKVDGTAPWGAVGLPRWALIGTRGGRERCYYHKGALVDK
jgi:hypothetical protein